MEIEIELMYMDGPIGKSIDFDKILTTHRTYTTKNVLVWQPIFEFVNCYKKDKQNMNNM